MSTRRKVLFVDDDPRVLAGLERMLFDHDDWDMDFVDSGQAALAALATEPYDALVTDMRMPGMNGAQLLHEVHRTYPATARFVLSGQADAEATMQAMEVAHQFLSKPCDSEALVETLQHAWELDALLSDPSLRSLVKSVARLPTRPKTYQEVCRVMADENSTAHDVSKVVETDSAVASALLRVVNSAAYGARSQTCSIAQAVVRLGARHVKGLVLACGMANEFAHVRTVGGLSVESINQLSVRVGRCASKLLGGRGERADEAFVVGLLHEVGLLVLLSAHADKYQQVLDLTQASGQSRLECERAVLGADRGAIGAYVMKLWGMTYPIIDAITFALHPARLAGREMGPAVAVAAARLAVEQGESAAPIAVETLGLSAQDYERLVQWAQAEDA